MNKHIFFCPCYFKHKINIDEIFIGKRIPTKILEHKGFILFPIAKSDSDFDMKLINPKLDGLYTEYECGDYSRTVSPSGKTIRRPRISAVFFLFEIGNKIEDEYKYCRQIICEIERSVSKFIKCVSVTHPTAVHWTYSKEEGYIEPIDSYYFVDPATNKNAGIDKTIRFALRLEKDEMSTKEFFDIYRDIQKNISLQYELLADVERCLVREEFREVVLNCATIIEKTLKNQISEYLDRIHTTAEDKTSILKRLDGLNKILKAMREYVLPIDACIPKIQTGTIHIRSRVIHGGYFPTKEEVEQAIKDARLILKQYNVPLFID